LFAIDVSIDMSYGQTTDALGGFLARANNFVLAQNHRL
jgi:hypothetical protein